MHAGRICVQIRDKSTPDIFFSHRNLCASPLPSLAWYLARETFGVEPYSSNITATFTCAVSLASVAFTVLFTHFFSPIDPDVTTFPTMPTLKEAERTHDDLTTSQAQQVEDRKHVAKDCIDRFEHLGKSINSHAEVLEALANDLRKLNTEASLASSAQFANAAATLRGEFDRMQPVITAESNRLHSYIEGCKAVEKAKHEWKSKREHYDETRHKVHKLQDKNKDAEKIHEKELKLAAAEHEYRDANRFLQTTALGCITTGDSTICDAANTVASALSRNYAAMTYAFQDAQPSALGKQASLHAPLPSQTTRVG
jgi:hypothetical protein